MRTAILIVLLFAVGLVCAASNAPTPAESIGKPKSNTAQVNQSTKANDNVTKSSSAIMKVPKPLDIKI